MAEATLTRPYFNLTLSLCAKIYFYGPAMGFVKGESRGAARSIATHCLFCQSNTMASPVRLGGAARLYYSLCHTVGGLALTPNTLSFYSCPY